MPSRKQRRRRQKERRHEYEYVYVDERGRELAPEELDLEAPQENGARKDSPRAAVRAKEERPAPGRKASAVRPVEPPSWTRVLKRTLIFAPIMFLTIALLDRDLGVEGQILITAQMLVIFVPFSYLMDRMMYRRHLKQTGGAPPKQPSGSRLRRR